MLAYHSLAELGVRRGSLKRSNGSPRSLTTAFRIQSASLGRETVGGLRAMHTSPSAHTQEQAGRARRSGQRAGQRSALGGGRAREEAEEGGPQGDTGCLSSPTCQLRKPESKWVLFVCYLRVSGKTAYVGAGLFDCDIGSVDLCHHIRSPCELLALGDKSVTSFVPSCLLSL